jgi:hypothetical protein
MLFASMVASTVDLDQSLSSNTIDPVIVLKRPFTFVNQWRTLKVASLWLGSNFQVVASANASEAVDARARTIAPSRVSFFMIGNSFRGRRSLSAVRAAGTHRNSR